MDKKRASAIAGGLMLATCSYGQVPDLLNALDAGGSSLGAGGALYGTNADTLSTFYNPAGLGYLTRTEVGLAYRNLPSSRSSITGTYNNPVRESQGQRGSNTISHLGVALPFSRILRNAPGTIALAYTIGGYVDDVATGPATGLPDGTGTFNIGGFVERVRARLDTYTLAYGRTNASQNLSYGAGIILAQQQVDYAQEGISVGGGFSPFSLSSTGSGIGLLAGVQYIPPRAPNFSLAASLRSEIDLQGNDDTSFLYDKIPGRFLLGGAFRREGYRGGRDYLVAGAQLQYFFGGSGSFALARDTQSVFGLGIEYGYTLGTATVPVRIGYQSVGRGGSGFASRNAFTYGIGYRPNNGDYSINFSWTAPQGGGADFAIFASYRFR